MKRKVLACILAAAMMVCSISPAFASQDTEVLYEASESYPTWLDYSDAENLVEISEEEAFVDSEDVQGDEAQLEEADSDEISIDEDGTIEITESEEDSIGYAAGDNPAFPGTVDTLEEEIALMQYLSSQVKEKILAGETSFYIPIIGDDIYCPVGSSQILSKLSYYCPYIDKTQISGTVYSTTRNSVKYYYGFSITCKISSEAAIQWVNTIDGKISELMNLLDSVNGQGDVVLDEIITLHDYMASHYQYDTTLSKYYPSIMLTEETGVCQSYAFLFQYIMNLRGYDCYVTSSEDMNHAWNLIKVNGSFYNMDVTWDDPIYDKFGQVKHRYLFFSDSDESHYGRDLTEITCASDYEPISGLTKTDVNSPIIVEADGYYYIDASGLKRISNGVITAMDSPSMVWPVVGGSGHWNGPFSGLSKYGNTLYYNTGTSLIAYDLISGTSSVFATVNTSSAYCYGCKVSGGQIYYALKSSPNDADREVLSMELPAAPHQHSLGEAAFSWSEDMTSAVAVCTCSSCGESVSYNAEVTVETEPATCSLWGLTTYTASVTVNKHNYSDVVTVSLEPLPHQYDGGVTIKEATKAEPGIIRYTCSECGNSYDEEVEYIEKPLTIISQPESVTAGAKAKITFTVIAENAASYKWQYSKNGTKWYNSTAATSTTNSLAVTVSSTNASYQYRCKITGTDGSSKYTDKVHINLIPAIVITKQPASVAVTKIGQTVSYHVEADNVASYQWQFSKDGTKWYISSATGCSTDTLTIKVSSTNKNYIYKCVMTGDDGNTKSSARVAAFIITAQPQASAAAIGTTASFSVTAENIAAYQWQYSKNGGASWYNSTASGADTDTVSLKATSTNRSTIYRCKLTNINGVNGYTNAVGFVN